VLGDGVTYTFDEVLNHTSVHQPNSDHFASEPKTVSHNGVDQALESETSSVTKHEAIAFFTEHESEQGTDGEFQASCRLNV